MFALLALLAVALVIYVFLAPVLIMIRLGKVTTTLERLKKRVTALEARLDGRPAPPAAAEAHLTDGGEALPEARGPWEPPEPPMPLEVAPDEEGPEAAPPAGAAAEADLAPAAEAGEDRAPPPAGTGPPRAGWEEQLASRWMIWLGGVTVALAAVFLFRYAVDQGWLTPMARVVLGLVLGGVLLSAGEWTQRRPVLVAGRALGPDYVPPALSASGIFAIFVSIYAAHAAFGLIGPAAAFVALGLVAYSALVLSLRQGWFVALLGILAGYLVPALIEAPEPNALAMFVYLYVLTAGALGVMVWRRWWWFSALAFAGALTWPVLWTLDGRGLADQGVLGAYALALAATVAALSTRLPFAAPETPQWRWLLGVLGETSGLGFALTGALLVWLAGAADFNAAAFLLLVVYGIVGYGAGLWRARLESLFAITAIVALGALILWPQPVAVSPPARVQELGTGSAAGPFGPYVMPPEFVPFARALWAFAALYGLGGYAALGRVGARVLWSGLSAFLPVVLFALAYARIDAFEISIEWAWLAAGLSVLMLLAAASVTRRLGPERRDVPLAFYAAGSTAAVALMFACVLREAWLTVAISAEIAALGWIWTRVRVAALRPVAVVCLAVVVLRLVANPFVIDYEGGRIAVFGWVVYGYGLPALACLWAARSFGRGGRDLTVTLCEIAAAGLGALMGSLQIRLWTAGSLGSPDWDLLDLSVQTLWWGVAAALLLRRDLAAGRAWVAVAGQGVLAVTVLAVALGQVFVLSPLAVPDPVGRWPVVNLLGLAYLAPALLFWSIAAPASFDLPREVGRGLRGLAGGLLFLYLTLEIRRAFQGSVMALTWDRFPSNSEIYAYSAGWILFALALLGLGILRQSAPLRYASLAVLMATVAKVFLYDMSDLTGLFRVASFLGLGLTLIAIGRVYRLYVFPPARSGRG